MSVNTRNPPGSRPVGIKDIALALGVSTGTVDRALHAKPGINPMTRARVLSMAESLGYRPNLAARQLKTAQTWRVSVHLPREIAHFWDCLRGGIREAAALLEPVLRVDFWDYPGLGDGDIPLFKRALEDHADGIIISPGDPAALKPWLRRAAKSAVPVVCVVTDAPDTERLTSISADPFTVGSIAGELLCRCLPAGGSVAFFTGWLGTQDHADKLRGFETSLKAACSGPRLAAVVEAHDDPRVGYRRTLNLLDARSDLRAIYVSTVNSLPVLQALEHHGRLGQVTVVTTDLFPELVPYIRRGVVTATLYQRPTSQGRVALQTLFRFLVEGACPPPRIKVVPHVVMRSNLDLILERFPQVDGERLAQTILPSAAPVEPGRPSARARRPGSASTGTRSIMRRARTR